MQTLSLYSKSTEHKVKIKTGKKKKWLLCEIWSRVFPTPLSSAPCFYICASLDRLSSKWSKLEPRPSTSSSLAVKRERPWLDLITWPPIIWVLKKWNGREGWQSQETVTATILLSQGGKVKNVVLPSKCAALAQWPSKSKSHRIPWAPEVLQKKVCPQWLFFTGKHLQAL